MMAPTVVSAVMSAVVSMASMSASVATMPAMPTLWATIPAAVVATTVCPAAISPRCPIPWSAHMVFRHAGRIAASEASCTALKVGEVARRTGPVARARAVLGRWKFLEYLGCAVEDAGGRWSNFDGFFVKSAAVHAEGFRGLWCDIQHEIGHVSRHCGPDI